MLYFLLTMLFILMVTFLTLSFKHNKKNLNSLPFIVLSSFSGLLTFSLYALTGSASGLEHYKLQMALEKLGGIEAVIRKIERHVAEHPEDKRGQEILERIQKSAANHPIK